MMINWPTAIVGLAFFGLLGIAMWRQWEPTYVAAMGAVGIGIVMQLEKAIRKPSDTERKE